MYIVPKYLFLPIVFLLLAFSNNIIDNTQSKIETKILEKIYIHVNNNFYTACDDIWFKIYLVDASTHKLETPSKVVYVDFIDPTNKIVASKIIKIENGCGEGDFKLPTDLIRGQYIVRGYTNFMRNFDDTFIFRKRIYINSKLSKGKIRKNRLPQEEIKTNVTDNIDKGPDLQFFPEGGYLIESLINRVGFKIVGKDGKSIDISGKITDNTGKMLGEFRTARFGLGIFKILPQKGRSYEASILYNGREFTHKLPVALESGVVMEISDKERHYKVILNSSLQNGIDNFRFVGRQRNQIMCDIKVSGIRGSILIVPKKLLEEGITQFTLYDDKRRALCERLVFVEKKGEGPTVNISSLKKIYTNREQVELEIFIDQMKSKKINANLSISVVEKAVMQAYKYDLDIRTHLLLGSELRGEIEEPGYYFHSDDPQKTKMLDILMMTQGWRKYIYNDSIIKDNSAWKYSHEMGINFTGSVKKFGNRNKPSIAEVSLTYSNSLETVYDQVITDEKGNFTLGDYDFMDSTVVIIQAKSLKGKKSSVKNALNPNMNFIIDMDSAIFPSLINSSSATYTSNMIIEPSISSKTSEKIDSIFRFQNDVIILDEMVVASKKIKETSTFDKKRKLYREPSNHLNFDDLRDVMPGQNVLTALNGRIPGLSVSNGRVSLRGAVSLSLSSEPIFLLDGMPVSKETILSVPIEHVDFVDILKGPKAAIYGSGSVNGVIAVYLLDGSEILNKIGDEERRGIMSFIHPGYSRTREFYEPVYETKESTQRNLANQSTIYWNPAVNIDNQNNAKIRFNSTNNSTTYKVVIEGITSEGDVIRSEFHFNVD